MDDRFQNDESSRRCPSRQLNHRRSPPLLGSSPRLLGTGLTILSGELWSGKSWLALDLALAVGSGGPALGSIGCEAADVLCFDMENGRQRLDARVKSLLGGRKADLSRIRFAAEPPPTGRTSVERLPPPDPTQSKRAATRCEAEPVAFSIPGRARTCIDQDQRVAQHRLLCSTWEEKNGKPDRWRRALSRHQQSHHRNERSGHHLR